MKQNKMKLIGVDPIHTLKAEKTVTMVIPRDVIIMMPDRQRYVVEEGTREIPHHVANHPYLRASGAYVYRGRSEDTDTGGDGDDTAADTDEESDSAEGEESDTDTDTDGEGDEQPAPTRSRRKRR